MSRTIAFLAFCLLTFISAACDKMPLVSPPDSAIVLSINTTRLAVNGTAQITAIVTEPGGNAPQNGTNVTFITTLGSIDPVDAQTRNGRATATFFAGSRSGTAAIRAFSGGAETEPIDVSVGGASVQFLSLRVESSSLSGTTTVIVATALDDAGNPVPGAPISFSADKGRFITSATVVADNNGEAHVTLATSETATVTARTGGIAGATVTATITIAAPGSIALVQISPAPPAPAEVGQPVVFTLTPSTGTFFSEVVVDFGDGTIQNLGAVSAPRTIQHTYTRRGTFTVTARGVTGIGTTAVGTLPVIVNDAAPLTVTVTATPNPVSLVAGQGLVNFTATATAGSTTTPISIARVQWSWGDGTPDAIGTALTINHRYDTPGTYVATVRITATDGRTGSGAVTVRVTP